jgi:hypothetical protein
VFRIKTDRGEIVVEVADQDIALALQRQGGVVIRDLDSGRTYTLLPGANPLPSGDYALDVSDTSGVRYTTTRFSLLRGGQARVTAYAARPETTAQAPVDDAWAQEVAGLPGQRQLEEVAARMIELNPDFDGLLGPRFENGRLVELGLITDEVTDISPLGALLDLQMLTCHGSESAKGRLTDLKPLRGLKLRYIDISANPQLTDLSPLAGMPLTEIACWCTPVSDLSPLGGMSLVALDCNYSFVSDLAPLKSMPLERLSIAPGEISPRVTDLTPLTGMPLVEISGDFDVARDGQVLRSMPNLKRINGKPAADFLNSSSQ